MNASALAHAYKPERDSHTPNEMTLGVGFAVYGTLRAGMGNHHIIERHGGTWVGEAVLRGYRMYDSGFGFPYVEVSLDPSDVITVEVVEPGHSDDERLALRSALDRLEGYSPSRKYNHYSRVAVRVMHPVHQVLTHMWMYIVTDPDAGLERMERVLSGDWKDR